MPEEAVKRLKSADKVILHVWHYQMKNRLAIFLNNIEIPY